MYPWDSKYETYPWDSKHRMAYRLKTYAWDSKPWDSKLDKLI